MIIIISYTAPGSDDDDNNIIIIIRLSMALQRGNAASFLGTFHLISPPLQSFTSCLIFFPRELSTEGLKK